jgi:hypothetical protein
MQSIQTHKVCSKHDYIFQFATIVFQLLSLSALGVLSDVYTYEQKTEVATSEEAAPEPQERQGEETLLN